MFLDMTIHDFDMARFLIGAEVEEVYAQAAVTVDPAIGEAGDVDTAVIMLQIRQRRDRHHRQLPPRQSTATTSGLRCWAARAPSPRSTITPTLRPSATAASVRRDLPLNFFMDRYTESFANEMTSFVDAVLHDRPMLVTG